MKKSILLAIAAVMIMPVFGVGAKEPVFDVGHLFYTNKSPFLLEGLVEPGSTVSVSGIKGEIEVDKNGKFAVDLPVKEGVNLFSMVIEFEEIMTIKGVMVEMDTTPPEVTLLVKDKPTQEKSLKIEVFDASEFTITGFTEPGCKILADDVDYSTGNVKFEAKFKVGAAPSKSSHKLEIIDRFGNKTKFDINAINAHIRTVVLQLGNSVATIDEKEFNLPVPPTVIKASPMIPVKFIAVDVLGGSIEYNKATKTILAKALDTQILMQINNKKAAINGKEVNVVGTPPFIVNGSTMVPFRFIGESFGFLVSWKSETKTITMTKPIYE
ncbi:MAG: hypothetical protein KA140_04970 [Caldisericia bacterium]|nr:hypothetical protein [Caldisericia bacterium]